MGRDEFRGFLCHLLHLLAVFGLLKVEEDGGHLVEDLPGQFIGGYGVLEGRSLGIVKYLLKFLLLLLNSGLDRWNVVGKGDFVERRDAIRGFPLLEEGILWCASSHRHYRSYR